MIRTIRKPLLLLTTALALTGTVSAVTLLTVANRKSTLAAYSTSLDGRTPKQLANIRRAADLLDDSRILPGQEFSLARRLGPTTADAGWQDAQVIIRDKVEPALAGGICQLSSTLYNAALLAGLEITERHAHSRPVISVPPGRDATVAWGIADLRIRNTRLFPVDIRTQVSTSRLVVQICGAGEVPPNITITTNQTRRSNLLIASVWRQVGESQARELVSTDEYRLSR